MRLLLLLLIFSVQLLSVEPIEIPKESYITFNDFLNDKQQEENKSTTRLKYFPNNWVRLEATPPLLFRFQIPFVDANGASATSILSVSQFSGNIGGELPNLNRWRSQLNLDPLDSLGENDIEYYTVKDYKVRKIALNNYVEFMVIYWVDLATHHYFFKVVSNQYFNSGAVFDLIESQSWEAL